MTKRLKIKRIEHGLPIQMECVGDIELLEEFKANFGSERSLACFEDKHLKVRA